MEISNEERREVVEIMRAEAQIWHILLPGVYLNRRETSMFFQDIMHFVGINGRPEPEVIYNRLADLIDRPTCRNVYDESKVGACENGFECSECGNVVEDGEGWLVNGTFNYCSECGAEVQE